MIKTPRIVVVVILVVPLAVWGCKQKDTGSQGPAPASESPGGPPPQGGRGGDLKQSMTRIGKGPNALHALLKQELNAADPAWDKIQPEAAEYARLAAGLGKATPPKGSADSWTKLAAAFAAAAADLDRAAQAKDRSAASTAHQKLDSSCMACHKEHRGGGGGGRGGPGGRDRGAGRGPPQ